MKKNKIALQITLLAFIMFGFIACESDFATLQSDIINDDIATSTDVENELFDIIAYTKVLGPVQSNGLAINSLGIYDDDAYGRVTSTFVVQPSLASFDPVFGEDVEIDSVILNLPYSSAVTDVAEDGTITFDIDSVIGRAPFKFSLFESNYFIRDFNPEAEFNEPQIYFSNKTAYLTEDTVEIISDTALESQDISFEENPNEDKHISLDNQGNLIINEAGFVLLGPEPGEDEEDTERDITRLPPGIRLKLDPTFWQEKIIDQEGETTLSSANNFSEYFRGLYFKAETNNNQGSHIILNTGDSNANITIFYSKLTADTEDEEDNRETATFVINFNGNTINFLDNDFVTPISEGDPLSGDSRIRLKGGEGALGRIKLFNGDDINDGDDNTFDIWKNQFVETNTEGEFLRSKRLVNEANLVFYVDQDALNGDEPDRIYLYDVDNKLPLVDYFLDGINNFVPSLSVPNHLGPLQRVDDDPDGPGIKYKFKITEHINNLLLRDSTNVTLGLGVSLNVNLEESILQRRVQNTDELDLTTPISSVLSPRGTVLHGSATEVADKKVYLEIYYTEPNN